MHLQLNVPRALCVVLFTSMSAASIARGAGPHVHFDVPRIVRATAVKGRSDRVIVLLPISSMLQRGNERQLREIVCRFQFLSQVATVGQVTPGTTLGSDVEGPIAVEEKTERNLSAGLQASGKFPDLIRLSGNASSGSKKSVSTKFRRRPPKHAVIVSGSIHRGRGAFVKFRPSADRSLEGRQTLTIELRVPTKWKTDLLDMECLAKDTSKQARVCGRMRFLIGVHRGDKRTHPGIASLVQAEKELRAAAHQLTLQRRRPGFQLSWRRLFGSQVPRQWLQQVIFDGAAPPARLPSHVQAAANDFLAARRKLLN